MASLITTINARTRAPFKPRSAAKGTSSYQLRQFAEATLGSGSLRKAVKLPEGEDLNEWLAVNVVDFYNQINLLYGAITEFCSPQSCPEMKATDEFEYLWQDSENFKRPTKMSAPEYIEHLMSWVQSNIDNEQMFPSSADSEISRNSSQESDGTDTRKSQPYNEGDLLLEPFVCKEMLPLPSSSRLAKNLEILLELVDPASLPMENTEEAVTDVDERLKGAAIKAKLIQRALGEREGASDIHPDVKDTQVAGDGTGSIEDISSLKVRH